jgi:hypothetical protein
MRGFGKAMCNASGKIVCIEAGAIVILGTPLGRSWGVRRRMQCGFGLLHSGVIWSGVIRN